MRSNTKFKHLQLVVAISERLHIGRVAEFLHLSQPAVSKSLAEIESLIGAQLFERTPSGLVETAQGSLFVRYARETLAQLGRVADDLAAARSGLAGTIHIGSMITASLLVPLSVKLLKERSPNTTVRIEDGLIEPLMEKLDLGQLDLVIVRLDTIPNPTGLLLETLYQDAVVVVAAPDSQLVQQPNLQWQQLGALPWVLPPPGTSSRRRYEDAIRQHGMEAPKDLVETASFLSMVTLTRERQGLCLLPEALARYFEKAGLVSILALPSVTLGSPIGIARMQDRRERPGVTLFAECFREAVRTELPNSNFELGK
ncbi:MAG: LysR substrate-binding domain-containing protein [Betaproteobacteria bacterium]